MPKTIYLHIGMYKTGSTSIQFGLYTHQLQLEAHHYTYPCLREHELAHHNLLWELKKHAKFDPNLCKLSELQAFIKQTHHDNIIISTEHFSQANTDDLHKLATCLKGHQVKVIIYLRRQDQMIQSLWSQFTKMGLTTATYNEWLGAFMTGHRLPKDCCSEGIHEDIMRYIARLNHGALVAQYADVFGQENIMVRAYERTYLNGNIFADFLQFIGMDDVAWVPDNPEHNVSPSIKTLEFLRRMALGWQDNTFQETRIYRWYFSQLEQLADRLGWNDQRLNLIDQARYDHAMQVYGEGNDRIAQTYLGRDKLFREPFTERPVTTFDTSDFQNDELITMMQEISAKHLWMLKTQQHNQSQAEQRTNWLSQLTRWLRSWLGL